MNGQECGFETPQNYQTFEDIASGRISSNSASTASESYCINVCFRILRDDNGSNDAINPNIIPQILAQLNSKFNPHGISFLQVGTYDYINNTSYNNYTLPTITNTTDIPNCLNIYFIKNFSTLGSGYGGFSSFGTGRSTVKGSVSLNGSTIHEVGHALNLLHTFNNYCPLNATSTESPYTTTGCITKGDKICDTPADYNPLYNLQSSPCVPPYPLNDYHPDKTNIMSYWTVKDHFTANQGERMRNAISGASQLQSIRSYACTTIVGLSKLCRRRNQSGIYSVSGGTIGTPTYNWSVTGGIQINGATTNPTVNVSRISNSTSILTLTINGTIIKTKTIRTGCFLGIFRAVGTYDWISKDYGNMGLIIPIDPEDEEDPIATYVWEITENKNSNVISNEGTKPYFVGATTNEPNKFISKSNQAVVNWGSYSDSYLITCKGISAFGEEYLITENYVEVGDPKNNPCYKNAVQSIIAPNPIRNGQINVVVNKPENPTPCNYKNPEEEQFFNSELDRVNNSITIFDFNGNEIYRNVFETNEFTIEGLNLISRNNYVVNLFTNEGGFRQQVIIAE